MKGFFAFIAVVLLSAFPAHSSALGNRWVRIAADIEEGGPTLAAWQVFQAANNGVQFNTTVFNCSSFSATGGSIIGACEATVGSFSSAYFVMTGTYGGGLLPSIISNAVNLMPTTCSHCAGSLLFQTLVNVQQFQATFSFLANGWNAAFVLQNTTNQSGGANGANFSGGAGCEGGIFQGFNETAPPNDIFAVMYDQYSGLTAASSSFTGSGVQFYIGSTPPNAPSGPGQSPCNPDLGTNIPGFTYAGVNKFSTAPVQMNSPTNATFQTSCSGGCVPVPGNGVATGDVYFVTITYDGNNLTADMYDQTAGGSCTPNTSLTCNHVVLGTGVNIPSIVGANTAYVGIVTSTADASTGGNMNVNTLTYKTP